MLNYVRILKTISVFYITILLGSKCHLESRKNIIKIPEKDYNQNLIKFKYDYHLFPKKL